MQFSTRRFDSIFGEKMTIQINRFLSISLTLLIVTSVPTYAEWVKIGADDTFTTYADPDTIRSKGTTMKVWTLTDLQKARTTREGKSILSIKMLFDFDCAEEQIRILAEHAYSGQMGTSGL